MAERSRPAPPHLSANRCRPAVLMRNVRRSRPSLQLVSLRERVQRESGGWDRAGAPRSPRRRRCHSEERGAPQSFEASEKQHLLRGRSSARVLRLMGNVVRFRRSSNCVLKRSEGKRTLRFNSFSGLGYRDSRTDYLARQKKKKEGEECNFEIVAKFQ